MYSFGDGSNGQLGHGTVQLNCTTPQQIIALKSHKIKWASCGENHTAAISGNFLVNSNVSGHNKTK